MNETDRAKSEAGRARHQASREGGEPGPDEDGRIPMSPGEVREVEEKLRLRAPIVYQIVREEGEKELVRPVTSLWWSGLAAGLAISMSVVSEGLLRMHFPDTLGRNLVENFGYCVGFLIVVLGRLQLFTENTITVVLPVIATRTARSLYCLCRLWSVVFVANMAGTFVFAVAAIHGGIFTDSQIASFREISLHLMDRSTLEMMLHAIPAGFLIAAMVWMLPSAEGADFWVIIAITYVIALGGMVHVVAGSTEAFLLLLLGDIGPWRTFGGFMVPALVGNVIGGTVLFTLLAYAQVKEEI